MLILPAQINHNSARACARMLEQALTSQGHQVVADASGLESFDSSALAVLLECRRQAQALGKKFYVLELPQKLRALAQLYGVETLLPAPF